MCIRDRVYKETYADLEDNAVDNLQELADENAKKDCWNRLGRNTTLDSLTKSSEKADYREFYTDAYNSYNKELTQMCIRDRPLIVQAI